MKHKKRGLALPLMLTLALLCGCEGTVSERPMEDMSALIIEPGADAPTADTFADQTQTVTLYLLSSNGERLVPVPTEVTMRAGESLAQAALTALLAGAKLERTDASWPMSGEGRAPTLSVSAGIATVNLPAKYRALEPQTLFAVRQAVADTLGSLSGVTSVNVLVGGREEGLDLGATTPVGTLTRVDDLDVQGRYKRLDEQRLSGAGYTRLTTLFFPSADGRLLLPAVRTLSYDAGAAPIDCLYTVLEALGSVAADALMMRHVPEPMGYIAEMPEIVRMEGGEQRIGVLALITRQYRQMLYAKDMQESRTPQAQMAKALGVPPFALSQLIRRAGRRTMAQLKRQLALCVNADFDIKRGAVREEAALDRLMLALTEK